MKLSYLFCHVERRNVSFARTLSEHVFVKFDTNERDWIKTLKLVLDKTIYNFVIESVPHAVFILERLEAVYLLSPCHYPLTKSARHFYTITLPFVIWSAVNGFIIVRIRKSTFCCCFSSPLRSERARSRKILIRFCAQRSIFVLVS